MFALFDCCFAPTYWRQVKCIFACFSAMCYLNRSCGSYATACTMRILLDFSIGKRLSASQTLRRSFGFYLPRVDTNDHELTSLVS